MHTWAILLAAGSGSRMNGAAGGPKQFFSLNGEPLYWHSALTFNAVARLRGVLFVLPPEYIEQEQERLNNLAFGTLGLAWRITAGGAERRESVRLGLAALPPECDTVLVHDAARPFVGPALINRLLDRLEAGEHAVIPVTPVVDTVKVVENGRVLSTPERSSLAAAQTPQAFTRRELEAAHIRARNEGWQVTDDAMLLERCGVPVHTTPGDRKNIKITNPEDLRMLTPDPAPVLLPCTGFGYDVHKYAPAHNSTTPAAKQAARPMRLGGVPIPGAPDVLAHSDGDVLLHALMDALLGLCGKGDIGSLFPDADPAFDNINSALLLDHVLKLVFEANVRLTHIDCTLVAQIPKIAPWREQIQKNLCRLLKLSPARVAIKATTEEGLGFTGEKKGIKAYAVVSGLRPDAE